MSVGLFLHPLGFERLDDMRSRTHALEEALEVRPLAEVEVDMLAPAEHGEQVAVGDGELLAHQEALRPYHTLQVVKAGLRLGAHVLLSVLRRILAEQRADPLVHFRVDEAQPFHQTVALHRARSWRELGRGIAVSDVLQHCDVLRQHLAVVERERRHVTLGIHLVEIQAVGGLLGAPIYLDQLELESRLAQGDARRQPTGSRQIVKLHLDLLTWAIQQPRIPAYPSREGHANVAYSDGKRVMP